LLVSTTAALFLTSGDTSAQESFTRGAAFVSQQDGPYIVTMHALPRKARVGIINFTIRVKSVNDLTLIENAEVEVVATNPNGEPDWLSPAISFADNPTSYVGNGEFDKQGLWQIEIRVSGTEGTSAVNFPIEVKKLTRSNTTGGAIALVGAVAATLIGTAWIIFSSRRIQRNRNKR